MMAHLVTRGTMQISGQQQSTVRYKHGGVKYTPIIPRCTGTGMPSLMVSRCAVLRIND